jgi:elongation factor 3
MIEIYANKHPNVVSSNLPIIIESLINLSSDVKKDVKVAVQECLVSICKTIKNLDIQSIIPVMIEGYMNPSTKTEYSLEKLASTPLVNDIDIPTLGLLIPMLVRAMREKKVVCQE